MFKFEIDICNSIIFNNIHHIIEVLTTVLELESIFKKQKKAFVVK